jgi:mxaK protein
VAVTRARGFVLPALAFMLMLALGFDGYGWLRAQRVNAAIREGNALSLGERGPPEAIFAQAYLLAMRGQPQRALILYREITAVAGNPDALRASALYNIGNVHLRQALAARADGADGQAMALFELAKQSYRDALSIEPGDWDAKYNLERVLRLSPETEEPELGEGPPLTRRRMPAIKLEVPLGPP